MEPYKRALDAGDRHDWAAMLQLLKAAQAYKATDLDGLIRKQIQHAEDQIKAEERQRKTLPEKAGDLVAALNEISTWPVFLNQRTGGSRSALPKGTPVDEKLIDNNCQTFFRALGEELKKRGSRSWAADFPLDQIGEPMADGIIAKIDKDANGWWWSRHWKKVSSWEDAQKLANQGAIVIGGFRADAQHKHGHIAIVIPTPPDMDWNQFRDAGRGPFVRDGNEHLYQTETSDRFMPSTWGAIHASRAMPLSHTSWYVWNP